MTAAAFHGTPTSDSRRPALTKSTTHTAIESPAPIKTVGYIGLGIMGAPMAANLIQAGFTLTVWNRTASKCSPLVEQGAQAVDSPAAMAEAGPDVICLNVTDTADVEAVLFGERGVAAGAKAGLIVVDHS